MNDVVIVGGGMAGLSAAMMLGRFRYSVTVVDAGRPRNAPAAHSQGYPTRDGTPPGELLAAARAEVRCYGGEIRTGTVTGVTGSPGRFVVETLDGQRIPARRVLVTTGLADRLPDVIGLAERFGRDVLACPFCHGYEARDQVTVTLAADPRDLAKALLLRRLTADLTVLCDPELTLPDGNARQLAAAGVRVLHGRPAALVVNGDRLTALRTEDGRVLPAQVLYVSPRMTAQDSVLRELGAATETGPFGEFVTVDALGRTTVPGVWAAGNVADPSAQLVHAASQGYRAATGLVHELADADATAAADYLATGLAPAV